MNKKLIYGAMAFAAFGLASCSSDEPVNNGTTVTDGEHYIAFQIRNVGGTRADVEFDGFENPIGSESSVSAENVRFYFFDANGEPFTMTGKTVDGTITNTNMVKPNAISAVINNTNGEDCSLAGTIILGTASNGYTGLVPAHMVCAVNLSDAAFQRLADKNLASMYDEKTSIVTGEPTNESGLFQMTSSTYVDNSFNLVGEANVGFWTPLTFGENIFNDIEAAKKAPAHIYIERLAAKVRATGLGISTVKVKNEDGSLSDGTFKFMKADYTYEEDVKLSVKLEGWQTTNNAKTVKYIKNLTPTAMPLANYEWVWNDPTLHRSYWATTLTGDGLVKNTWDIYSTENWLGNYNATGTDEQKIAGTDYIYPNTTAWNAPTKLSDRTKDATGVLIKATIGKGEGENFQPLSFVNYAGNYIEESEFRTLIAQNWNSTHTVDEQIVTTDISFERIADFAVGAEKITTPANKYSVMVSVGTGANRTKVYYGNFGHVEYWKDGVTSYYVNIQHALATKVGETTPSPLYGIVRNHIYDMNFTGVVGLGVPGNQKEDPEPDKETYVACHIDVLNWHVVKNNIVLE